MTQTPSPEPSDRLDRIERNLEVLTGQVSQLTQDVDKLRTDLAAESKKWDDRFFQLSRDTLNFSRNVIVTAGIVAVLVPALREAIVALVETFKSQ
jgi:hypothetical protein